MPRATGRRRGQRVAGRAAAAFAAAVGVAAALGGAAATAGGAGAEAEAEAVAAEVGAGAGSPHRHLHQFSNGYAAGTILGGFGDFYNAFMAEAEADTLCQHPIGALIICPLILGGAGLTALTAELAATLGSAAWPTVQSSFA